MGRNVSLNISGDQISHPSRHLRLKVCFENINTSVMHEKVSFIRFKACLPIFIKEIARDK